MNCGGNSVTSLSIATEASDKDRTVGVAPVDEAKSARGRGDTRIRGEKSLSFCPNRQAGRGARRWGDIEKNGVPTGHREKQKNFRSTIVE